MKKERQPDAAGFLPPEAWEKKEVEKRTKPLEVKKPQKISDEKPEFKPSSSEVRQPRVLPPEQGANVPVQVPGQAPVEEDAAEESADESKKKAPVVEAADEKVGPKKGAKKEDA